MARYIVSSKSLEWKSTGHSRGVREPEPNHPSLSEFVRSTSFTISFDYRRSLLSNRDQRPLLLCLQPNLTLFAPIRLRTSTDPLAPYCLQSWMLECEELRQQSLRAGFLGRGGNVTERDSPVLALTLAPALARTVYLLATSPPAILPLLQLRILVLCNPQPMELSPYLPCAVPSQASSMNMMGERRSRSVNVYSIIDYS